MQNLIYLLDSETNGYTPVGLDIIALVSILFSISVIIIKNPISSVLSLIALFFGVACYLVMLGLTFIGLSYLLLYVGAVSILFLFILMLINVRVSELSVNTSNSIPLVIIVSALYIYIFNKILPTDFVPISSLIYSYKNFMPITNLIYFMDSSAVYNLGNEMQFVTSKSWDSNIAEAAHITSIGNIMYTSYLIWLLLTSIILLLAMVGCIVITIKDNINII